MLYLEWLKPDGTIIRKRMSTYRNDSVGSRNGYGWILINFVYIKKNKELCFASFEDYVYYVRNYESLRKPINIKWFSLKTRKFIAFMSDFRFHLKNNWTFIDVENIIIIILLLLIIIGRLFE